MKNNSNTYMIEGIGDEVVQFFAIVLFIFLVIEAWRSTRVRETQISEIILLYHWVQSRLFEARMNRILDEIMVSLTNTYNSLRAEAGLSESETAREESSPTEVPGNSTPTVQHSEEATLPKQNVTVENVDPTSEEGASRPPAQNTIKIKLKFTNSSEEKTCDVDLNEKLGDFRRRNFPTELSRGKNVVLIFFGRVLDDDERTLGACGVFRDCVVHCVVRPARERRRTRRAQESASPLLAVLAALLLAFWYSRVRYTELFSVTATAGLLVLTGLYVAFLASQYAPPPPPPPPRPRPVS